MPDTTQGDFFNRHYLNISITVSNKIQAVISIIALIITTLTISNPPQENRYFEASLIPEFREFPYAIRPYFYYRFKNISEFPLLIEYYDISFEVDIGDEQFTMYRYNDEFWWKPYKKM